VSRLDVAGRQAVEIAKAMSFDPSVLLLDEPTSALSDQAARGLFRLVHRLREQGVIVIYITHRLQELGEVADEVSVLRDGRLVGSLPAGEATAGAIAQMMFGEEVTRSGPAALEEGGGTVLEVRDLRAGDRLAGVSLSLEAGEVLGIAGTLGSGRTELLRAIFGADPLDGGEVLVAGRPVGRPGPAGMKGLGVGLTPENRKEEGLVQDLSVADNLCLASLGRISRLGVVDRRRRREQVERTISDLRIAVSDPRRAVATLSGGNQQKVVLGNWLNTRPRVMLLDEPTRGIDIQAKQQVFSLVRDLSRRGIATIFVSSELEELLEVCHRVLAMRHGRIVAEFAAAGLEMETLLAACLEEGAA
jgi:ABC-type sugar transport system ATPase subunit